jgi:hypothetical protein
VVRDFLTRNSDDGPIEFESRVGNFLLALFEKATETLTTKKLGDDQFTRIKQFREFMSKDQHMGAAGLGRLDFYKGVVSLAQTVR